MGAVTLPCRLCKERSWAALDVCKDAATGAIPRSVERAGLIVGPPADTGVPLKASSSIGRAAVSKTAGWGFDSLLACHSSGETA